MAQLRAGDRSVNGLAEEAIVAPETWVAMSSRSPAGQGAFPRSRTSQAKTVKTFAIFLKMFRSFEESIQGDKPSSN